MIMIRLLTNFPRDTPSHMQSLIFWYFAPSSQLTTPAKTSRFEDCFAQISRQLFLDFFFSFWAFFPGKAATEYRKRKKKDVKKVVKSFLNHKKSSLDCLDVQYCTQWIISSKTDLIPRIRPLLPVFFIFDGGGPGRARDKMLQLLLLLLLKLELLLLLHLLMVALQRLQLRQLRLLSDWTQIERDC